MSPIHLLEESGFSEISDDWKEDVNNCFYTDRTAELVSFSTAMDLDHQYYTHLLPGSTDPLLPISPVQNSEYRSLDGDDYCYQDMWNYKSVKTWEPIDVLCWLSHEAQVLSINCTEFAGDKFAKLNGMELSEFREKEFEILDKRYGNYLYQRLQSHINAQSPMYSLLPVPPSNTIGNESSIHDLEPKYEHENIKHELLPSPSETLTNLDDEQEINKCNEHPPEKKKPGRPKGSSRRKTKPEKLGRLWEFIRDLLKNKDYCPSLIVWDNYEEGTFRFVRSDQVAKLWGSKKDNPDMTYEKLSRAMRYYYKSKVLQPVIGRRLVYKFGPTATGWRVDNPNFKN